MTSDLTVTAGERGKLRVFAVNLSDKDAQMLADKPDAAAALLGVDDLDNTFAEVLAIDHIAELGLPDYLHDGYDVPSEALAADRARLAALEGYVLIVLSLAFRDKSLQLAPGAELTFIGSYPTAQVDWSAKTPVTTESARPGTGVPGTAKKRPSDAAMSGRIAMAALIVLAVLTYVIVWIAG